MLSITETNVTWCFGGGEGGLGQRKRQGRNGKKRNKGHFRVLGVTVTRKQDIIQEDGNRELDDTARGRDT